MEFDDERYKLMNDATKKQFAPNSRTRWAVLSLVALLGAAIMSGDVLMLTDTRRRILNDNLESTTTTPNNVVAAALPPVHINSSWIGNQWMPPAPALSSPDPSLRHPHGYRLYTTQEIQNYFCNQSVLFVGDSTARRAYGTFYALLNQTVHPNDVTVDELDSPHVIDAGKGNAWNDISCDIEGFLHCRRTPSLHPSDTHNLSQSLPERKPQISLMTQVCVLGLKETITNPNSPFIKHLENFKVVVFAIGPWELLERCIHPDVGLKNATDDALQALFELADNQYPDTHFIWRTWGFFGTTRNSVKAALLSMRRAWAHNAYMKRAIDAHDRERAAQGLRVGGLSYIDWGRAMLPRLYPQVNRIAGDMDPHYGLEARLAFVQMMVNHLVERDRLRTSGLVPYGYHRKHASIEDDQDDGDMDHSFLTVSKPPVILSEEDQARLDMLKSLFCGECLWAPGIFCSQRVLYLRNRYGTPELEALKTLVEGSPPSCLHPTTSATS